ncbi:MAG: ABC transporter permease [Caldilineaceae bacterium]|nr:ABC transporter permease [Caldilineaceae bacterium]
MQQYILRRLVQMIFVLFLFSMVVFAVIRLVPGDPVAAQLGLEASEEAYQQLRQEMGLDQPLYVQYMVWIGDVVQGDFGTSWRSHQSAFSLIQRRFPATIWLTLASLVIGLAISIPLGIISGVRPHSWLAHFATFFSLVGIALPSFWLGLMLLLTLAVSLRWLPPSGYISPLVDPVMGLKFLLMPAITLGIGLAAPLTRFLRSGMLDVMNADYVRTARAKGLVPRLVIMRHVLKNAMLSVVTIFGVLLGSLLGGSIITESVFNWPGIGTLLLQAIQQRDYGIVQGVVLFISLIFMVVNLLVDLTYAYLDPRIRYQ